MKIKRLYITDEPGPSTRKELCWEDEYGNWCIGDTNSPNAFAQGMVGSPGAADNHTQPPHPEAKTYTVYADWLTKGEDGASREVEGVRDPVIIEAYRRWNAGWYVEQPPGDIELPKPGKWTISETGDQISRIHDL